MKRFIQSIFLFVPLLAAQSAPPAPNGMPPIIDRELFFGNPEIAAAQISPDGKRLAFVKPWNGVLNVWVKGTDEPFSAARLLTAETLRPVSAYLWTRNSKNICFAKDNNGDENFNLYAVDVTAKTPEGANAPPARDLTGAKRVTVQLYSTPKSDPDAIYIGLNDRMPAWHDLYKVTVSTGQKTLVRRNLDRISGWIFDLDGKLRLATRTADNGDQETLRVAADGLSTIYSCSVFETCRPLRFTKDGKKVWFETNKGDMDLGSLALMDPETGKTEVVESDPMKRVDLGSAVFSEATDELAFTTYTDDRVRRYFKDKTYEADFQWLATKLPHMEVGLGSRSADDQVWVVSAYSDTEPGETYLFDRKARRLDRQYAVFEKLPRQDLAAMQAIHYESSDGLAIPAYLTLPKGIPAKALPLVVVPHGGPWARDVWAYNPLAQFLANRGYAVLMPNFRGSTGYGKKFLNAGNGEWGRKMQDDLTWGVKYLVAQGTVDSKRVGILGGSYGGYAALAGAAFTPDLYRAVVDIVGPCNLKTLLDAIPPYWEAGRKIMYARMADPSTPEGRTWFRERSPLYQAGNIKAAMLVAQGANDPRVNKAEAEQIVVALREHGHPVEYLLAPDEGHGFVRPQNSLALFAAVDQFLAKQLGGRCQEGASPEVAKRLSEITVDPKTVTVSTAPNAASVAAPKLERELRPGTYKYDSKLAIKGQEFSLTTTTTIEEEKGSWAVTEVTETPAGPASDKSILDQGTLTVRKRILSQGKTTVEINFTDETATGTFDTGGQVRPIKASLEGPLFADAAGSMQALGCLPLADGFSLIYRNFDLQTQKVRLVQAKVAGSEKVTVPAGTFDTFKLEITPVATNGDKATIWIAKDTRQPVKMATTSAIGAVMTAELTK